MGEGAVSSITSQQMELFNNNSTNKTPQLVYSLKSLTQPRPGLTTISQDYPDQGLSISPVPQLGHFNEQFQRFTLLRNIDILTGRRRGEEKCYEGRKLQLHRYPQMG